MSLLIELSGEHEWESSVAMEAGRLLPLSIAARAGSAEGVGGGGGPVRAADTGADMCGAGAVVVATDSISSKWLVLCRSKHQ